MNFTPSANFTIQEYKVFHVLLIFEFICLMTTLVVLFLSLYIVFKHPQFHWNLIGIMANLVIIYIVIVICRLGQMVSIDFDPDGGESDRGNLDKSFRRY